MGAEVRLCVDRGGERAKISGQRVVFSPYRCFKFDDAPAEQRCLDTLAAYLRKQASLAFFGGGPLLDALLTRHPDLAGPQCLFVRANETDRALSPHE